MLYKATVSFSGVISWSKGQVGEISDQTLVDDLINAGYIIPFVADREIKEEVKTKPKTKRKGKANED
jgi:hypothetical protein